MSIISLVVISTTILLLNFFILPIIDRTYSNPYFHIRNTPLFYWIGFASSCVLAMIVILKYIKNRSFSEYKYIGILSILLLTVYLYVIPPFFYKNHIYTDTYLFVGEMMYVLNNGRLGYGWSSESPALSIISSSLSLITGLNYLKIVDVILFLIPVLFMLFFYVISSMFLDKKTYLLSYLTLISLNWFSFQYNRQSLGLVIQLFTLFCVLKVLFNDKEDFSNYVVMFISYISLIITHPASPFVLSINILAIFFFMLIIKFIYKGNKEKITMLSQDIYKKLLIKTLFIGVIFVILWLIWQVFIHGAIYVAYRNLIKVITGILSFISPTTHISGIISVYSKEYKPIVMFRLYEAYFITIVGNILSLYMLLKSSNLKQIILASWFTSSNWFLIFVLYSRSWIYRPIIFSLPSLSIILSLFLSSHVNKNKVNSLINKTMKISYFGINILLIITLPMIMYAHSPFFYPPTSYLNELEFVTQHVKGPGVMFEASSELRYHVEKNNSSLTYFGYPHFYDRDAGIIVDKLYDVELIAIGFRVYTKDGFISTQPPVTKVVSDTVSTLTNLFGFGRFYDSGSWHRGYINMLQ